MANYCVNKNAQSTGEHEVHNTDASCSYCPDPNNRVNLGNHSDCHSAVTAAKAHYPNVDGCYYCCKPCHTR